MYTELVRFVNNNMYTDQQYRLVLGRLVTHTWLQSQPANSNNIFKAWEDQLLVHANDVEMLLNIVRSNGWKVIRFSGLAGSTTFRISYVN